MNNAGASADVDAAAVHVECRPGDSEGHCRGPRREYSQPPQRDLQRSFRRVQAQTNRQATASSSTTQWAKTTRRRSARRG